MFVRKFTVLAFLILPCLIVPVVSGQVVKSNDTSVDSVTKKLVDDYQKFIDEVRETSDRKQQVKMLSEASAEINSLLQPILLNEDVSEIFSLLSRVQLVNIDASFRRIIDNHAKPEIRAAALLNFAKHCSNNYRDKTAEEALVSLKKEYGTLNYQEELTFADAAEDAMYFAKHLANGRPAPNFVGEDADGVLFRLKDYKGKVVMLRFWGDWCPPCRAMYDFERELVQKHKNENFALIGVNSDSLEDMKAAQRRSNLTWRSIWDGGNTAGPVATLYQIETWPTIVLIDADGVIRFRSHGFRKPQLESAIKRCLAEATAQD